MCPATNLRGAPSGPRFLWTGADSWLKGEVAKAGRELGRYAEFASLSEQIAEVNENLRGAADESRPRSVRTAPGAVTDLFEPPSLSVSFRTTRRAGTSRPWL
jgi:hypothetical protein